MLTIGIDPGKFGAYAVIRDNDYAAVRPFDLVEDQVDWHEIACRWKLLVGTGEVVRAVIEKVGAMPGQGVTSMFNFGKGTGTLIGILVALEIPYLEVAPQTWKAVVLRDTDKSKGAAVLHCAAMWPKVELPKQKKQKEGCADALSIAEWGWLKFGRV